MDNAPSLAGRHALVTGAGSGIGAAIAQGLGAAGATVTLVGRRAEALETIAGTIDRSNIAPADVTDPASIADAFDRATAAAGPVDLLINNAGAVETAKFTAMTADQWQRILDVNLSGVYHCMAAALPAMLERGFGRIVNVASTSGLKGYAYVSAYCAAKHGVIGLTRSVALEVAGTGVTVNAVCPGYTDTELVRASVDKIVQRTGKSRDDIIAQFAASMPTKRLIQPEEVARTVLWLCRDTGDEILGQSIVIAGGEIM